MTEPARTVRVVLVDDHSMFRSGVRAELAADSGVEIVGEAGGVGEAVAAEVEDAYVVQVESVVVGDAEVDDRLGALVQATREALVNAAKHAGVETVSLYAEVEPDQVTVFVRDRGAGFDPEAVRDDRHGVRGSIVGRMERHGGAAAIRSMPGAGTEVELTMDRSTG